MSVENKLLLLGVGVELLTGGAILAFPSDSAMGLILFVAGLTICATLAVAFMLGTAGRRGP